ncbi:conserved oligomeric Golgi complex subunit 4 [Amyelois transitella]|uniref:conserved oligomeric Golgi complex subunit 4 n=1 Tax=Amyelois transitella TaxID=680683 RepID=UPI0029900925|nr:conserved oligomeric Golgi complex subunit 4 [Amyelois transitella]
MSLTLLLEKYDVSTEEGLQKAITEIEKEEAEVDEALSDVLSRACSLEGRLRTASQAYTKLGEVKADAQVAADMVDKTAVLARDVSAKVRQLDLARCRVAECQRRVHDLIDLQLCSAGVEAAIKAHDYETGAAHVSRFLSMDPRSLHAARARGAPSAPDPRRAMAKAADTLREHLVTRFQEASKKEDDAAIERLFKLFPQIGRAEEGVNLLAKYLARQVEANIRRASVVSNTGPAVYAEALTRVLEIGGAAVERVRKLATGTPGLLNAAIVIIQPVVCAGASRVSAALRSARADVLSPAGSKRNALAAEPVLLELALCLNRIRLYFDFLTRKVEADASTLDEANQKAASEQIEKTIAKCELTRTAQDLLGQYLALERFFLEESVNKALKLAAPSAGAVTSSLVDDVFFIARKVIRRSISTGSVDGACAVLNEAGALLERACAALRRCVRAAPPDALPLPAPPARGPADAAPALALNSRLNRDVEAQRSLFLAHMNEAEAGGEWAERLAAEAVAEAAPLCRSRRELDKLQSCAAGLGSAAAAFVAAHELSLAALAAALKHKVVAWAEYLADPGRDGDEAEDDCDAGALPQALETLSEAARQALSASSAERLLSALVSDVAARAEARVLLHHYTRMGGFLVERRARRLAAWCGGGAAAARERCARLAALGALLALDSAAHAADVPHKLGPQLVRDVLARRIDFKIEDIKRLKL